MTGTAKGGLVLGVDGGASKTVAVVADRQGRVVGAARAGNADIYQSPQAIDEVARAIAEALAEAGAGPERLEAAVLSLVGADWPEDFVEWEVSLGRVGLGRMPKDRVLVVNDALGALAAGAPEGPAVAVVCGTGCAVGARGEAGRSWHSSFWQRTQGGGELALKALDAVFVAELGIAPPTRLTALALAHFEASSVEALLHDLTGRDRRPSAAAATFAPRVLDAAEAGDAVAHGIALAHAEALAGYGLAGARQAGIGPEAAMRLVLAGGVFRHGARLMPDHVAARMREAVPGLVVVEDAPEPIAGAIFLALGAAGVEVGTALRRTLRATLPPAGFFTTARPARTTVA